MAYRPLDRIWTASDAASGVVSLELLKEQMYIDSADQNTLLTLFGDAAVASVEKSTLRLLSSRTCTLSLRGLPTGKCAIELPGGVVSSLTSVVVDGVEVTGGTVIGHSPALLLPSVDWPEVTGDGYPVTITYVAGYSTVPFDLVDAVLMIAAELEQRRSEGFEGSLTKALISAEYLMKPYRIMPIR
jgi:hypothetical protein